MTVLFSALGRASSEALASNLTVAEVVTFLGPYLYGAESNQGEHQERFFIDFVLELMKNLFD